jgi:hypothetical protein
LFLIKKFYKNKFYYNSNLFLIMDFEFLNFKFGIYSEIFKKNFFNLSNKLLKNNTIEIKKEIFIDFALFFIFL